MEMSWDCRWEGRLQAKSLMGHLSSRMLFNTLKTVWGSVGKTWNVQQNLSHCQKRLDNRHKKKHIAMHRVCFLIKCWLITVTQPETVLTCGEFKLKWCMKRQINAFSYLYMSYNVTAQAYLYYYDFHKRRQKQKNSTWKLGWRSNNDKPLTQTHTHTM